MLKMVTSSRTLMIKNQALSESELIWRTLYCRCKDQSPFSSYDWYTALCTHIGRHDPDILSFWHGQQPVGVMAAMKTKGVLRAIQDERVTDVTDILIEPGFEIPVIEALAGYISDSDLGLDIFPLESTSTIVKHLPLFLDDIVVNDKDVCPYLNLPTTWTDYLKYLKSKHRHELRRKMRRAAGIELHTASVDHLDVFLELMARSDIEKKKFLTPEIQMFIKGIVTSFAHENWLHMRYACLGKTPVAALLSFKKADRIYLYNSGYDPRYMDLSPGIVSIALDIKHAIQDGSTYYDFLRGKEIYKLRFGTLLRTTKRISR